MAAAGGAKLASGYIALSVRYASALDKITQDFSLVEGKARSSGDAAGRSITAGLVNGARSGGTGATRAVEQNFGTRWANTHGTSVGRAMGRALDTVLGRSGADAGRSFAANFDREVDAKEAGKKTGGAMGAGMLAAFSPALIALSVGTAGISTVMAKGFARNADLEDANNQLQLLGMSADQISTTMTQLTTIVKGTAFSISDTMTIATNAIAAGIKPGEELNKYISTIADSAAYAKMPLSDMGAIFNKVHNGQKLMTDDMNQMSKVPLFSWMQKEFNVTGEQLQKALSDGDVSAQKFEQVMAKYTAGTAQNMGDTTRGSMGNLWTGVARLGANILKPFFGDFKGVITSVTDGLDAFGAKIGPVMQNIATWFKGTVIPRMKELWPIVKDVFTKIWAVISEAWTQIQPRLQPFMEALKRVWTENAPILKTIGLLFGGLVALLVTRVLPIAIDVATGLLNAFAKFLQWVKNDFWPWLQQMWRDFLGILDEVQDRWDGFTGFFIEKWNWLKDEADKVYIWFGEQWDGFKSDLDEVQKHFDDFTKHISDGYNALNTLGGLVPGGIVSNPTEVQLQSMSTPMTGAPGLAPEAHLKPGAIAMNRAVTAEFPEIKSIGGWRANDPFPDHPSGQALDIMMPNGVNDVAFGNKVKDYLLAHADDFGLDYLLWQQRQWNPDGTSTPMTDRGSPTENHMDHIHGHVKAGFVPPSMGPSSGSGGLQGMLVDRLRAAGLSDDEIKGIVAMNQVESGGKAEGFLGFTESQAPTPEAAVDKFLNEQWKPRTSGGIPGVTGDGMVTDWNAFMTFIRIKIVGQQGVVDWQGNQQPPAQDYQNRLLNALGTQAVTTTPARPARSAPAPAAPAPKPTRNDSVALMDFESPLPPPYVPKLFGADGSIIPVDAKAPGTVGGIQVPGMPGSRPTSLPDVVSVVQSAPPITPKPPGGYVPKLFGADGSIIPVDPKAPGTLGGIAIPGLSGGPPTTLPEVTPFDSFAPGQILQPKYDYSINPFDRHGPGTGFLGSPPPSYGDVTTFNPGPIAPFTEGKKPWALGAGPGLLAVQGKAGYGGAKAYNGPQFPWAMGVGDGMLGGLRGQVWAKDAVAGLGDKPDTSAAKKPPGPDGTKDDPISATIANPDALPGGAGSSPTGVGTGAGAGSPTGTAADAKKSPLDGLGGLGDVGMSMFSDQFAGTEFQNPLDWANVKSLGAGLSFFGNLLSGDGSGALGALGIGGSGSGSKSATSKQLREAQQDVDDRTEAYKEAQAAVGELSSLSSDESRDKANKALAKTKREMDDSKSDLAELQGKGGGGGGLLSGLLNSFIPGANGAPLPGVAPPPEPGFPGELPVPGGATDPAFAWGGAPGGPKASDVPIDASQASVVVNNDNSVHDNNDTTSTAAMAQQSNKTIAAARTTVDTNRVYKT